MEISTDDVALLIGQMQIELFALRKENQILRERLEKLQPKGKHQKRNEEEILHVEKR
jgi:hypothetical protein